METAQSKIARLERSITRAGESVTFERVSADGTTGETVVQLSVVVPAHVRSSEPQDLIDSEARDIKIVVSPTVLMGTEIGSPPGVFGIPFRDDRVLVEGITANVQTISPIYYRNTLVRINILARG